MQLARAKQVKYIEIWHRILIIATQDGNWDMAKTASGIGACLEDRWRASSWSSSDSGRTVRVHLHISGNESRYGRYGLYATMDLYERKHWFWLKYNMDQYLYIPFLVGYSHPWIPAILMWTTGVPWVLTHPHIEITQNCYGHGDMPTGCNGSPSIYEKNLKKFFRSPGLPSELSGYPLVN